MFDDSMILLFIRAPLEGQVKSRLAAEVGEKAALDLYRSFILDIIDTVETTGKPFEICYFPSDARVPVLSWLGPRYQLMPQEGSDLGERMERAFARVFAEGAKKAVLIGSDLPDLPASILRGAFEALQTYDAVIGPAADGGYYLTGFNDQAFLPGMFRDIAWSTNEVFQKTMDALNKASLRVHLAPQWRDVDTLADLKALFARYERSGAWQSRTAAYLKRSDFLIR